MRRDESAGMVGGAVNNILSVRLKPKSIHVHTAEKKKRMGSDEGTSKKEGPENFQMIPIF